MAQSTLTKKNTFLPETVVSFTFLLTQPKGPNLGALLALFEFSRFDDVISSRVTAEIGQTTKTDRRQKITPCASSKKRSTAVFISQIAASITLFAYLTVTMEESILK